MAVSPTSSTSASPRRRPCPASVVIPYLRSATSLVWRLGALSDAGRWDRGEKGGIVWSLTALTGVLSPRAFCTFF